MKQIRIGKILLTNGGTWNAATGYPILTYVLHNGDGWWSAKANVNSEPSASNRNWVQATDVQPLVALMRAETESAHEINEAVKAAEQIRIAAESSRTSAENARVATENARQSAENARVAAENIRVQNEDQRKSQEAQRQTADLNREKQHAQAMASIDAATELASSKAAEAQAAAEASTATDNQVKGHEQAREEAERTREAQEAQRVATFQQNEQQRAEEFASKEATRDAAVDAKIEEIEAAAGQSAVYDLTRDFGKYSALPSVTLTALQAGTRINSNGEFVSDAAWNVARLGVVSVGNTYELKMGDASKMVLGTALFVAHTIEKRGNNDVDVYTPLFSAMTTDIPASGYVCFEAMEAYEDVLVCYRTDVAGATELLVRRYGTKASIATQINNLKKKVDLKSFADGYYAGMRVGTADNLTPRGEASEEMFMERVAGGTHAIEDGDAAIKTIKGKTLMVVQIVSNPSFDNGAASWNSVNKSEDGNRISFSSANTAISAIKGHVYAVILNCSGSGLWYQYIGSVSAQGAYKSLRPTAESAFYFSTITASEQLTTFGFISEGGTGTISIKKDSGVRVFDLTAMGLESVTTAQAFAEALGYPSIAAVPYFAYTEGKLLPSKVEGVRTTGRNLWDEEWEVGNLNPEGELNNNNVCIRSKNYNKCKSGESVYLCILGKSNEYWAQIFFYDINYNFISRIYCSGKTIIIPNNAHYFKIATNSNSYIYGGVYKNDICLNYSDPSFNGQYEPYEVHERKWGETIRKYFPDGLKSAGDVYDEITPNKAIKRVGVVDLGSLTWNYKYGKTNIFQCTFVGAKRVSAYPYGDNCNQINSIGLDTDMYGDFHNNNVIAVNYGSDSSNVIAIRMDAYDGDLAGFKTAIQGHILYYELAEPEEYTYDELNLTERVFAGGMEQAIVPEGEESAPLVADIVYPIDAYNTIKSNKAKIEALQQKPAISLTADEVTKLRALISTATQSEGGEL